MMSVRRAAGILWPALLLALWVVCTALHVKQLASGQLAWVGVYVTQPRDDAHPTVRGVWPGATPDAAGALVAGDRLLRAGDTDLRGVGPFGFVARAYAVAATRGDLQVPLAYERDGAIGETTIALVPVAYPWRMLPLTGTMVATATLVLLRRRKARIARTFFLLAVAFALHWTFFFGGPTWQTGLWTVVFFAASSTMLPLVLRAVMLFPPEIAPPRGRLPWWPWGFAVFGPISLGWVFGVPLPPWLGFRAAFVVNVAFIVTVLALLTRNFRRAGPVGRRQLKWVLLGMYVGTMPVLLADALAVVMPSLWWLHEPAAIAEIAIPLCILIAIVRANLFDVDRLITGAAVYTVLSIALLAAALFAVPQLAGAVSAAAHLDARVVEPMLSVVIAAGLVPGHRLLRPRIERVLFRERHALQSGIDALLRELAEAPTPDALFTTLGERLDGLVRPRSCLLYAPLDDAFVPVFDAGAPAPPNLPADTAVVTALRRRTAALDLAWWRRTQVLAPTEGAVLDALGAATLVPVRRGDELAAIIALGPKRSGDVYTPTDLALLSAVAATASSELLRFDAAGILEHERAMSAALRRYVPEPVAMRLTRGQSIDGGEHDVAVVFVDIRGYTTFSEGQAVGTVFSMVNRYTEAVSAVIQRHGGTVVEFLGDGVMAVFGAPDHMPDPAGAAVRAACEVVAAVRALPPPADGAEPIAAGVGIASGTAFVGNVRTNDRLVYTAVGDVVNLASRIERLTRELHAAVAVDAQTYRRAGALAASFDRHERVTIRGRAEPVDVFTLPLTAA